MRDRHGGSGLRFVFHAVAARRGKEGGATRLIREAAGALSRVAPEHEYIFLLDESLEIALPEPIKTERFAFHDLVERFYWDQISFRRITKMMRADVAVAFLGFGAAVTSVPQVTVIPDATYFSPDSKVGRTRAELGQLAIRKAAVISTASASVAVCVPSRSLFDSVSARSKSIAKKLSLLRYGYDGGFAEPSAKPWVDPVRILYVSQLQPHKAHITLVDIARSLEDRDLDYEITVAINRGDNPRLWDEFHSQIRFRGLAHRFDVRSDLGREGIRRLYAEADCFVYPSVIESFGFPMLEAIAAGLPVVAVSTPINREMLGPGALYYARGEEDRVGELVEMLAGAGLDRADMVLRGQEHMRRILPTWDEHAADLERILVGAAK